MLASATTTTRDILTKASNTCETIHCSDSHTTMQQQASLDVDTHPTQKQETRSYMPTNIPPRLLAKMRRLSEDHVPGVRCTDNYPTLRASDYYTPVQISHFPARVLYSSCYAAQRFYSSAHAQARVLYFHPMLAESMDCHTGNPSVLTACSETRSARFPSYSNGNAVNVNAVQSLDQHSLSVGNSKSHFMQLSYSDVELDDAFNAIRDTSVADFADIREAACNDVYPQSAKSSRQKPRYVSLSSLWNCFMIRDMSWCCDLIRHMNYERLRKCCSDNDLCDRGSDMVLRRRIEEFVGRVKLLTRCNSVQMYSGSDVARISPVQSPYTDSLQPDWQVLLAPDNFYSHLLIIDLEATCDNNLRPGEDYPHEIIQFPVILHDTNLCQCIGVFHAYCKPVLNPKLTKFCKQLTHIEQEVVDQALPFADVLHQIDEWLCTIPQFDRSRCAVVCDCSSDMGKFMQLQCRFSGVETPDWARVWINLSTAFRTFYRIPQNVSTALRSMLGLLSLTAVGDHHNGLFDAINIYRIVRTMLADGCQLRINEGLVSGVDGKRFAEDEWHRTDGRRFAYVLCSDDSDSSDASSLL